MRQRLLPYPGAALNLLPFLDIIFATIGVFIVVFALQEVAANASGRQLTVDYLVICTDGRTVAFYSEPAGQPANFTERQFPALLDTLAKPAGGIRNLVFTFTAACFDTRRKFEEEVAGMTALFHAGQAGKPLFRMAFRPLSEQPGAVEQVLAAWRDGSVNHGK